MPSVPTPSPIPVGLLRVTPDDPDYRRLAEAEAEFWRQPHPFGLETIEHKHREGAIDRYNNERFTGRPDLRWYEVIAARQRFERGLMLGTTALKLEARILETNPALHLTFVDIAEGPLQRRVEVLGRQFPGRVDTRQADLNFLALEPAAYDLVVSSGTVHHVTNLEHLAWQIDRGLTADGWCFLQDYVGEPRFGFTAEKKRVFEQVYTRDLLRQRGRTPGLVWNDASDLSPLCGVRSNEILRVFRAQLDEVELHTASTLMVPLLRSRPADAGAEPRLSAWRVLLALAQRRFARMKPDMLSPELTRELIVVGDVLADSGVLEPGIAFAIYRKRGAAPIADR